MLCVLTVLLWSIVLEDSMVDVGDMKHVTPGRLFNLQWNGGYRLTVLL
jgi:hypothetical protein